MKRSAIRVNVRTNPTTSLPYQARHRNSIPATACRFSGCERPYARTVGGFRVCELHAERLETSA